MTPEEGAEDIADLRNTATNLRGTAETHLDIWDQCHTLNVELQILFKANTPADRELMVARLMQLDVLTKGVFDVAKLIVEGVAVMHEQQAERLESQQ